MLTALTRRPGTNLGDCELEYLSRQDIDFTKATEQHRQYEACLTGLGVKVISLPADPQFPDGVFVEDPAVVVDEIAVMTRMKSEVRRREGESVAAALARFRKLDRIREPATLEGGDVMRVGKTLCVGISSRTNQAGAGQLAALLDPLGYRTVPVGVRGCLHLKTACSWLGERTLLANREWLDAAAFPDFEIIDVAAGEPWAANVLRIGKTIIIHSAFPRTAAALARLGFQVRPIDVSELMKAEAGLTCMSILFET